MFKFVFDYEWEVEPGLSNKGKGDLIFTDGNNNFLIVECKKKKAQDVRQQTLKYMKLFKVIQKDAKLIKGMAVTKKGWDLVSDESNYWELDINEQDRVYYEFFDDLDSVNDIKLRDKFQEFYKELGITPNNPINTLKELEDKLLIVINYNESKDNTPPFYCEVSIKTLEYFPKEKYYGKGEGLKKKEAKAFAYADICNQIFLPYHMKDLRIPINDPEIKKLISKEIQKDI